MVAARRSRFRTLEILEPQNASIIRPDSPGSTPVETWVDGDARECAYSYAANGCCWVHFPGVAAYSFRRREPFASAFPEAGTSDETVEDVYHRFVFPLTVQAFDQEVLHASAVVGKQGLIAFCGDSGAGKSTMAFALAERGYAPWADDAVGFEARAGRVVAVPLPFMRRLRSDAIAHFGERSATLQRRRCSSQRDLQVQRRARALRALFVLDPRRPPRRGRAAEIREIGAAEAFTAVLPFCQPFTLQDPSRKRRMVAQYLRLSSQVPVIELRFIRGWAHLPFTLDLVEAAVRSISKRRENSTCRT